MRFTTGPLVVLLTAALALTACSRSDAVVTKSASTQGSGGLIAVTDLVDIDPAITDRAKTAVRITYRSTSGRTDEMTTVTGSAFIPRGKPPRGGWPVVALGHGTTGIESECGPSGSPTLLGSSDLVAGLLGSGYAVTVADYQGLGGPGGHPYLDARTAGANVIDSVRALRALSPNVSDHWAAYGGSQGGAAVWAANEQAALYAPDLHLVGTVSLSPAVDISEYARLAADGALNPTQLAAYVLFLGSQQRTRIGFDLDAYRRDIPADTWAAALTCDPDRASARDQALATITPEQLEPSDVAAQEDLRRLLVSWALPQRRASAPMLVIYGGVDEYFPPKWIEDAIARACAMGSWVAAVYQPDKGHGDVDPTPAIRWLADRFDGDPAPTTC